MIVVVDVIMLTCINVLTVERKSWTNSLQIVALYREDSEQWGIDLNTHDTGAKNETKPRRGQGCTDGVYTTGTYTCCWGRVPWSIVATVYDTAQQAETRRQQSHVRLNRGLWGFSNSEWNDVFSQFLLFIFWKNTRFLLQNPIYRGAPPSS